jgi:hypothetical protein
VNGNKGYETLEGLAPDGTGSREFFVSKQQIEHVLKYGPESKFYELFSVSDTLKCPSIIAEGLKREGYENALCYIAKPKRYGDGWNSPASPKMVFLVCMTDEFKVFEWRWEPEDADRLNCPKNAKQRFTKIKWKRSSTT